MQIGSGITEPAELLEDTSLSMEFTWAELMELSQYMGTGTSIESGYQVKSAEHLLARRVLQPFSYGQ